MDASMAFGGGGLQCFGCERVQRALHTSAVRYAGAGCLLHTDRQPLTHAPVRSSF
jgi:hypothetical protein